VVVGIEATGATQWFLELLEELGIECRVGHPAKIRAAETRKQKHDRRDAEVILELLLMKDRFPDIWMPSTEQWDLRTLLRDRHQWVKMRTRLQHTSQAIALNHVLREGRAQWTAAGRRRLQDFNLARLHRAKTLIRARPSPRGGQSAHDCPYCDQACQPLYSRHANRCHWNS
jgi:transposase